MNVANIKKYDVANGVGVRVSLFVSGCTHRCKGCFNAEAWDFGYGTPYTGETETEILEALDKSYIAGLSLLGGEPFEPCNQRALLPLVRKVRGRFPQKTVWCYTGYLYDTELQPGGRAHCEATDELLSLIDILVDDSLEQCRSAQEKGVNAVLAVSRATLERAHEVRYGGANWRQIDAAVVHIAGLMLRRERGYE